jgi:hypothetical protein
MSSELSPEDLERCLFYQALDLSPGPGREAFLTEACRDNEPLLRRLQALLRVEAQESDFLPDFSQIIFTPPE